MIRVIDGVLFCFYCGLHYSLDFRTASSPFTLKLEQEISVRNFASSWCLQVLSLSLFWLCTWSPPPGSRYLKFSPDSPSLFTRESGSKCFRCLQLDWAESSSVWEGLLDGPDRLPVPAVNLRSVGPCAVRWKPRVCWFTVVVSLCFGAACMDFLTFPAFLLGPLVQSPASGSPPSWPEVISSRLIVQATFPVPAPTLVSTPQGS